MTHYSKLCKQVVGGLEDKGFKHNAHMFIAVICMIRFLTQAGCTAASPSIVKHIATINKHEETVSQGRL